MKELIDALSELQNVAERHALLLSYSDKMMDNFKAQTLDLNLGWNRGGGLPGHGLMATRVKNYVQENFVGIVEQIVADSRAQFAAAEQKVLALLRQPVQAAAPVNEYPKDLVAIMYSTYFTPAPGEYAVGITAPGFHAMMRDFWNRAHGNQVQEG